MYGQKISPFYRTLSPIEAAAQKGQKNDGLQPKYRFGFLYISMKEMSRKIMGLAEVQIWISMNVYREIGKKNDGLELKYRFGFLLMYEGNQQKNHGIETKYRFGFA